MEFQKGSSDQRTFISAILNMLSLGLSTASLLSSEWFVGTQKVPKPLCGQSLAAKCFDMPMSLDGGIANTSAQEVVQYTWETGDDRFSFLAFTCCMASAVTTFNMYTRMVLEFKCRHSKSFNTNPSCLAQHHRCFLPPPLTCTTHAGEPLSSCHQYPSHPIRSVSEAIDLYSALQDKEFQQGISQELKEVVEPSVEEQR